MHILVMAVGISFGGSRIWGRTVAKGCELEMVADT